MEKFIITHHENYDLLTCPKRKLEIQVIHTEKVPESVPDWCLLAYGRYLTGPHPVNPMDVEFITGFGIVNPEKIEYEPYFKHQLIRYAIDYWAFHEFKRQFDEVTYSVGYQKAFIDSMSLDPTKMTPELIMYCSRDISEEPLDFYTWKAKRLTVLLN